MIFKKGLCEQQQQIQTGYGNFLNAKRFSTCTRVELNSLGHRGCV